MSRQPPTADDARAGAAQRLQQSRARMAAWLAQEAAAAAPGSSSPWPAGGAASRRPPWLTLALGLLAPWWRRQPLRALAQATGMLGGLALPPLVRRHPLAAVASAATTGALLVACRPWRLLARRSVWTALATRMLTQLAWQALALRAEARSNKQDGTSPVP